MTLTSALTTCDPKDPSTWWELELKHAPKLVPELKRMVYRRVIAALELAAEKYPHVPESIRPKDQVIQILDLSLDTPQAQRAAMKLGAAMDLYARGKIQMPTLGKHHKAFVQAHMRKFHGAREINAAPKQHAMFG